MNSLKTSNESVLRPPNFTIQIKQLISEIDSVLLRHNNYNFSRWKKAHYKAVKNWLLKYKPPENNPSNLAIITGYIEALYHLCKVEDWDKVKKILSMNVDNNFPDYQFHNQLGIWGLYKQQISIYCSLLEKIDYQWDCRFLEGLGNAYDALGNHEKAIDYRQQWRQIAQNIGDKKEEGKALCNLGISDSFSGDLVLAAFNVDKDNLRSIKPMWKRSNYTAIVNWLTKYSVNSNSSNLEKLKGFIETFFHFCGVESWLEAKEILLIRLDTPTNEELHQQLQTWGYYREAMDLYFKLFGKLDSWWEAITLTGIGKVYIATGDFYKAIDYLQKSLAISKNIGAIQTEINVLNNLGKTYRFLENNYAAIQANIESLRIAKNTGNRINESLVMSDLGVTYVAIKDNKKALYYLQKSLDIAR
ncbi:MAG: tetratricopeptide repeat protein [Okeania sp. SIO2C9]|uniref:tetratricopeptide repeat protein n=1 Tax=Okeania sp. SIO2C9 TaxID=2607791 RepID=UPI0013BF8908|nr:tetratricopeptide repeat protein [Okeania sp. SIO2C9]NEQ77218.1 tetratricopeptide repeat protein [Okeania sp. SIO2C9]